MNRRYTVGKVDATWVTMKQNSGPNCPKINGLRWLPYSPYLGLNTEHLQVPVARSSDAKVKKSNITWRAIIGADAVAYADTYPYLWPFSLL